MRPMASSESGYPQIFPPTVKADQALGSIPSLIALLGVTGTIRPPWIHSPIRSCGQHQMSGPFPAAAACWNLAGASSGCSTVTCTPLFSAKASPIFCRPL